MVVMGAMRARERNVGDESLEDEVGQLSEVVVEAGSCGEWLGEEAKR